MIFYTTDVGIQAAINAGLGGPHITLSSFRVGADFAFSLPAPALPSNLPNGTSATDIYGVIPAAPVDMPLIGYRKVSEDTVEYNARMPATIGSFDYGNIGIYTDTGVLFAIAVLDAPVHKEIIGPGTAGNVIEYIVRLTFGGASVIVDFEVNPVTNTNFLEVASVDNLPTPSAADANAYLVNGTSANPIGLTDNGDATLAFKKDEKYWNFEKYSVRIHQGAVTTSTITSLTSAGLPQFEYAAGRFLIQFTSGAHEGVVRAINSLPAGGVEWYTSTGSAVAVGTTFDIICSDVYALTLNQFVELPTVNVVPLVALPGKRTYRVTRNRKAVGAGTITFEVTNTEEPTGIKEWVPTDHGLVFDSNNLSFVSNPAGNPSGWVNDTTHVVYATPLLPDSVYAGMPVLYNEYILSFFTGSNQGYITEVISVDAVDDGVTQWIRFTLGRALPNAPTLGAKFKLFYPTIIGGKGGTGGGGVGAGDNDFYEATATDSGDGFQYILNTGTVRAAQGIIFISPGYVPESLYSVTGTNEITMSAGHGIPVGVKYQAVERARYGIPGGSTDQLLTKLGPSPYDYGWKGPQDIQALVELIDQSIAYQVGDGEGVTDAVAWRAALGVDSSTTVNTKIAAISSKQRACWSFNGWTKDADLFSNIASITYGHDTGANFYQYVITFSGMPDLTTTNCVLQAGGNYSNYFIAARTPLQLTIRSYYETNVVDPTTDRCMGSLYF